MIEGHGDDCYKFGDKVKYNFSTNIISRDSFGKLADYLYNNFYKVGNYPEPAPYSLESVIADSLDIGAENVVVTSGATDAIYRIALIFRGKCSGIFIPTFREYQDACKLHGHDVRFIKYGEDLPDALDLLWLCNPNNPTGKVTDSKNIRVLAKKMRRGLVVIDQAYASYSVRPVVSPKEAIKYGNMALLSSLTKQFSVPGLRIGYVVASAEVCEKIRNSGMPWSVSVPAIEGAKYLIEHKEDFIIDAERLNREAVRIAEAFESIGIQCGVTDCNFILCRLPHSSAAELKRYLVERFGILIRDASNFEGLDSNYFRIASQGEDRNDLLIEAVREWMK